MINSPCFTICFMHKIFFCGVRGRFFVLIMFHIKNTKEVAWKGASLVNLTPSEPSAQELAAVSGKKKDYIQKDLHAGHVL